MKILVTNDDSHDSPLFEMLLDEIQALGDVTIAVPAEEQSWTGKCISRFGQLSLEKKNIADHEAYCIGGSPADCANLAIYNLFDEKPDLVISGINIGFNCGTSYVFSSGTVGACFEANIAGVPALSISRRMSSEHYQAWNRDRALSEEDLDIIRKEVREIFVELRERVFKREDFLAEPITWQVELPQELSSDWELCPGVLGHSFYEGLFHKSEDGLFRHNLQMHEADPRPNSDYQIILRGDVCVSQLDIRALGQKPPVL